MELVNILWKSVGLVRLSRLVKPSGLSSLLGTSLLFWDQMGLVNDWSHLFWRVIVLG